MIPYDGLVEISRVFEAGCKYGPRNWEKGMPLSGYLRAAIDHLMKEASGYRDEPHAAQAGWNILAYLATRKWINKGILPSALGDVPVRGDGRLRIYVAGPYSAPTEEGRTANRDRAAEAGVAIMRLGHLAHVPHTATGHPSWSELGYETFMNLDFDIICRWANALLYLAPSPGADRELALAKERGLRIFRSVEEVPRWASAG